MEYQTYRNDRFGFSVDIPASFQRPYDAHGDSGALFESRDRRARVQLFGMSNNVQNGPPLSPEVVRRMYSKAHQGVAREIEESVDGNHVTIIATLGESPWGLTEDERNEHHYFVGPGSTGMIRWYYPASEKDSYKDVVGRVSRPV